MHAPPPLSPQPDPPLRRQLRSDLSANRHGYKEALVVVAYRVGHHLRQPLDRRPSVAAVAFGLLYRVIVEWVLGIEIPWGTRIGPRLRVFHGVGIVINDHAVIGADCMLRQGVTIGNKVDGGPCPILGDRVEVGANVVILGGIHIGDDAVVGAGAVVTRDVPAGAVVVGNPARILTEKRT